MLFVLHNRGYSFFCCGSAERIVEILNETSDINNPETPILEVKNGSVEFNSSIDIEDYSMENMARKFVDLLNDLNKE